MLGNNTPTVVSLILTSFSNILNCQSKCSAQFNSLKGIEKKTIRREGIKPIKRFCLYSLFNGFCFKLKYWKIVNKTFWTKHFKLHPTRWQHPLIIYLGSADLQVIFQWLSHISFYIIGSSNFIFSYNRYKNQFGRILNTSSVLSSFNLCTVDHFINYRYPKLI